MLASLFALALASLPDCLAADAQRIQQHLLQTEASLRAHPPARLSSARLSARLRNLDHLHRYAIRGVVPKNELFAQPEPFFIDVEGTRCAMAALIEAEGGGDFVLRIARSRNNARVAELLDEPELVQWLERNGMTAEEAGRVQPTYFSCAARRPFAICQGDTGSKGAQVLTTRIEDGGLFGIVEKTHHVDGGLQVGDEMFLLRTQELLGFEAQFAPGSRAYAQFSAEYRPFALAPMGADGRAYFLADRRCVVRPSADWATLVALSELDWSSCVQALAAQDGAWLQSFCHSTDSLPDYCLDDGGVDPRLVATADGGRPLPVVDAGPPDAGAADAGSGSPPSPTGCGCSAVDLSSLLAALALVAFVRPSRFRPGCRRS